MKESDMPDAVVPSDSDNENELHEDEVEIIDGDEASTAVRTPFICALSPHRLPCRGSVVLGGAIEVRTL